MASESALRAQMRAKRQASDAASDLHAASVPMPMPAPTAAQQPPRHALPCARASLGHDCVEGFMTIRAKKPKRLFKMHRPPLFAVCDATKPVLEVYRNDTRMDAVYVLSLVGAVLSFEADDANIVMEKCFCVEVQTWKKRNTVYFRQQSFLCFQDDQARMLQWVKCIHSAIKNATLNQLHCHLLQSSLESSTSSESPAIDDEGNEQESRAQGIVKRGTVKRETRSECAQPSSISSGLQIDTTANAAALSSSTSTKSPPSRDPKQHFNPLNTIVSALRSPTAGGSSEEKESTRSEASTDKPSHSAAKLIPTFHLPKPSVHNKTSEGDRTTPQPLDRKRISDLLQLKKDSLLGVKRPLFMSKSARSIRPSPSEDESLSCPSEEPMQTKPELQETCSTEEPSQPLPTLDRQVSLWLKRILLLFVALVAGILRCSIFLPLAAAGLFAHVDDSDADAFVSGSLASLFVFLGSFVHESLGISCMAIASYVWSYADFKHRQRKRRVMIADRLLAEEQVNFAHIEIPNWLSRPDVDRVEWLNRFVTTAWPCMKIAIRNSLMGCLNPVLEASRPAFISSLSFVRIDMGDKPPHFSGIKHIATNSITEEITLDIELRIVSDETLVAEVRMVPNLGAAALVTLRDLFLVGTLRITFHPLSTDWPCFSALSLSFTSRPVFDFSLTAAKINLSNVPFASEWLHALLHDLLLDYFVWPTVFHVPLWEGTCSVITATAPPAPATATATPTTSL